MSHSNIPGVDAMQDSLEFIKKMWGGMGVPGMVVPTLSVDEINKKIADLKAVESWLNLNLNMLRTTIQALEVQSATLTALQAMAAVSQSSTDSRDSGADEPAANAWTMPPGFPFSFMNPGQGADAASVAKQAEPEEEPEPVAAPSAPENAQTTAEAASLGNANAWWDLLQNQFKQAVNSVAATEKASRPVEKPAAKSAAKAGAQPRSKAAPKQVVKKTAVKPGARTGKAKTATK
ncbi:putative tfp pilus assembly protein FimV [Collimonas arenae]|uniref:PhaM family polyhydroxyalkanoate granule multifunctional regulatory protein n=1 Tax=Collimonas arenae TaxID=279058 RepID=UPI00078C26DA|nr:PhaM family polyhydroxyalkanoate granule multifunctional regulatory protein [Collimonas arenae]AMP01879.1 putative tfp pilus assembly protein FimV [Collimonas arenae]